MEKIVHRSSERGFADHGWLKATHSFSFANYFDRNKIQFGMLRVLNDDVIAPSRGFGMHPHENMEIITIPLLGALKHADNMGNEAIITSGEVQVMSAGTGVFHSEFNASETESVNLFQIWIFTDKNGHPPRYDQKRFSPDDRKNRWQLLVSPDGTDDSLWIHQNAFISAFDSTQNTETFYKPKSAGNGVYIMVVDGAVEVEGTELFKRDAAGFWAFDDSLKIRFNKPSGLLVIEVPMD